MTADCSVILRRINLNLFGLDAGAFIADAVVDAGAFIGDAGVDAGAFIGDAEEDADAFISNAEVDGTPIDPFPVEVEAPIAPAEPA